MSAFAARCRSRWLLLAPLALVVGASPAHAGRWHQVTPSGGTNIEEVALLRTGDGVLHVAWVQKNRSAPATQDIASRSVAPTGDRLGPVSLIAAGWASVSNPALTLSPDGVRAFFGGIRTTNAGETNDDLNTATSADGGQSWTLQIGNASDGPAAYASSVSATVLPGFFPLTAWGASPGTFTAFGTTPGPTFNLQSQLGGDFGYDPGLTTSSGGVPYVAWASNATDRSGVWAQPLRSDGTPAHPPALMPGILGRSFAQQLERTPITARVGGGVYVAYPGGYPTTTRVVLWRVGDPSSRVIFRGPGDHHATVSATSDGRLWVVWSDDSGRVFAARSNRSATAFGAVVRAGAPGPETTYSIDASAAPDGGVDVFALSGVGATSTFQTRVLPGLSLRADRRRLRRGHRVTVTFTVLDAGAPVPGATVSALGRSATTTPSGRAKLDLTPTRPFTVVARHAGYERVAAGIAVVR